MFYFIFLNSLHLKLVEEENPGAQRHVIERMHSENFANCLSEHASEEGNFDTNMICFEFLT